MWKVRVEVAVLLLFVGCRTGELHALRGNIQSSTLALDFGTTAPNRPVLLPLALTNRGAAPLHLDSLRIDGADGALFTVTLPSSMTLASGVKVTLTVSYTPITEGSHKARLVVKSDANNAPELAITLTGRAALNDLCTKTNCEQVVNSCRNAKGSCTDGACSFAQKEEGSPCDDQDLCTENDVCQSGICRGTPIVCSTPRPRRPARAQPRSSLTRRPAVAAAESASTCQRRSPAGMAAQRAPVCPIPA